MCNSNMRSIHALKMLQDKELVSTVQPEQSVHYRIKLDVRGAWGGHWERNVLSEKEMVAQLGLGTSTVNYSMQLIKTYFKIILLNWIYYNINRHT